MRLTLLGVISVAVAVFVSAAGVGCDSAATMPEVPTGVTMDGGDGTTQSTIGGPATRAEPSTVPGIVPPLGGATALLPDLVGLDLQLAQDILQDRGWYLVNPYDATGKGRMQLWDRNWVVVEQGPAAGQSAALSKVIELGVVEKGDPGSEVLRQEVGLPDVTGDNLQLAIDTMQSEGFYMFTYMDVTGKVVIPVVHRNWVVAAQEPSPGSRLSRDRVVTLEVKKMGE
jgi:hypothetical protein